MQNSEAESVTRSLALPKAVKQPKSITFSYFTFGALLLRSCLWSGPNRTILTAAKRLYLRFLCPKHIILKDTCL